MEAYTVFWSSNCAIMPSRYLNYPPDRLDTEAERAFILACIEKKQKDEAKANGKKERFLGE